MDSCYNFMFHVCLYYTVLSVYCSHVITCWECLVFGCLGCDVSLCFVSFPYSVSGKAWYLIVSISDLCLLIS